MARYLKAELIDLIETVDPHGQVVGIMLIGAREWGDRAVPIVIGAAETLSIKKGMGEVDFPRPLSHDLFIEVVEALGAEIEKITIDAVVNNTFTATVYVKDREGKIHTFDSRPSDAVALAVRINAPIYMAENLAKYAEDLRKYIPPPGGKVTE
ncbi:MAG: bifunctional nuclease family protein, partial [Pyrobaculum sp.]